MYINTSGLIDHYQLMFSENKKVYFVFTIVIPECGWTENDASYYTVKRTNPIRKGQQ